MANRKTHLGPSIAKVDWERVAELGKEPDAVTAARYGVTVPTVCIARSRLQIPPYKPPSEIDWDAQPLGEKSDQELADELGVGRAQVLRARAARGIPPFQVRRPKEVPAPVSSFVQVGRLVFLSGGKIELTCYPRSTNQRSDSGPAWRNTSRRGDAQPQRTARRSGSSPTGFTRGLRSKR